MNNNQNNNVVPFKKNYAKLIAKAILNKIHINIATVIFFVIAIYIIICVIHYMNSSPITGYSVKEGSLSVSNIYTGLILREEEVVNSSSSGYVNYYAREGERVSNGDLVYTVDSSGKLTEMLNSDTLGENTLSDKDLSEIRNTIIGFTKDFNTDNFQSVYGFKYDLQGTSVKLSNMNILNSIDDLNSSFQNSGVSLCNATQSGYVVYNVDGFETTTVENITADSFNTENYQRTQMVNSELISAGDPVCKFVTSEHWDIIIPVTEERGAELLAEEYVKVRFLKTQEISNARTSLHHSGQDTFCVLSFNNSAVTFCSDRFIDIELITEEEKGLKIPNSAIVEKEFFLIPKSFMTTETGEEGKYQFLKETYLEDGTVSTIAMDLTIYNETETDYYVNDPGLRIGDHLIKSDSGEKYTVSKKGTLTGVYNMNKGYADFRQIIILYQNEEYSIVKSNTSYGLSAYDYIVLESDSVQEDEFVHE